MPSTSATLAASMKSMFDEQYSLSSSSSQFFMKMPTTSQPWALSRCAVTAESTPPLRPTTTRGLRFICAIIPGPAPAQREQALVPMLHRPTHPSLPRQRMSPAAMVTSGALHVALVWLLLQHAPLQQAIRYVVYQYVKPVSPGAQPASRA